MKPLTAQDLWPLPVYEQCRDAFRKDIIQIKKQRRFSVGPSMSFVFENRQTVKFQIQEILRVEKIDKPTLIAEELESFNALLPEPGELSCTLFVELTDASEVREQLKQLVGLSKHVALVLDGDRIPGDFESGREEAERISAVQYVRFRVGPRSRLAQARRAAVEVSHPGYRAVKELSAEARSALAEDLPPTFP